MGKTSTKTSKGPSLTATLRVLWRTMRRDVTDPYRPELHYMRGPGPKWHAKYRPQSAAPSHAAPDFGHTATA
jgi:hypothetical protein